MLTNRTYSLRLIKRAVVMICAPLLLMTVLSSAARPDIKKETRSAAQLLKEASSYQSADDTSDRAAELYRTIISTYPNSVQAEQAQFFLGTYYQKKFYILEYKSKVEDWSSFNQAESALYGYVGKYGSRGSHSYLADAYHMLAIIALRRGYRDAAQKLLQQMKAVAAKDPKVYMYKFVWSARSEDVTKGYCDTKALADANANSIGRYHSFNDAIEDMRNWCRNNCR